MQKRGIRRKLVFGIFTVVMLFTLYIGIATAACISPSVDMTIGQSTELCSGTYTLTDDRSPLITISGDNMVLDCGGATLINGQTALNVTGIYSMNHKNVTITNCNLNGFYRGITVMGMSDLTINRTAVLNSLFQGIYSGANYNLVIDHSEVSGTKIEHGLYLDTLFDNSNPSYATSGINAVVMNSEFNNNKVYGIHINGASRSFYKNVKIHHNTFTGNNEAIDDMACKGCEYYKNTMTDDIAFLIRYNGISTPVHWSEDNKIYDNTIRSNTAKTRDLWITSKSRNNAFYNNTYSDGALRIWTGGIYSFQDYTASFEETTEDVTVYMAGSSSTNVKMDYPGRKIFSVENNKISLSNLKAPYNDVKDSATGNILASNVESYSLTLNTNQRIIVGNFVADPVRLPPVVTAALNSADRTNNTNSDLTCIYSVTGQNGVSVNTQISWYRNNVLRISSGMAVLDKKNLTAGDTWYCKVTATDAYNTTVVNSNSVRIVALPVRLPPIVNAALNSVDNTTGSDLTCVYSVTGQNGISVNTRIAWYKNNQEVIYNGIAVLDQKNLTSGDTWHCRITATDSYNITVKNSNQISIKAPPVYNVPTVNVVLNSVDNTTNSDLTCVYSVTGRNGVPVNTRIAWYKNNQEVIYNGISVLDKKNLTAGDTWHCRVTATDTYNITVKNSNQVSIKAPAVYKLPIVTAALNSADSTVNSDLNCVYSVTGQNGVPVNSQISWYRNNVLRISNGISVLNHRNLTAGDTWHCRITATDSFNSTSVNSNSLTIMALPTHYPPIVTVALDSADNTTGSDLTCIYSVTGMNNLSVNTTVSWYRNGTRILNGPSILGKGNLSVGDLWYCKIIATDSFNTTNKNSNSITILAPPVIIPEEPYVPSEPEEKKKSGGGGGGGSGYVPSPIVSTPVSDNSSDNSSNDTVNLVAYPEDNIVVPSIPVQGSNDVTDVSGNAIMNDDGSVTIGSSAKQLSGTGHTVNEDVGSEPFSEEPTNLSVYVVANKVITVFFVMLIIGILIFAIRSKKSSINSMAQASVMETVAPTPVADTYTEAIKYTAASHPSVKPARAPHPQMSSRELRNRIVKHINAGKVTAESLAKLIKGYTEVGWLTNNDALMLYNHLHAKAFRHA